jgi:hypothetical protein
MATQSPLFPPGQYVQYNPQVVGGIVNTNPTVQEKTLGIVRHAYTAQGKEWYQVVWNPGSNNPRTGLYHTDQLIPLTQDQAVQIMNQLAAGTFKETK